MTLPRPNLADYIGKPWGSAHAIVGDRLAVDHNGNYCWPRSTDHDRAHEELNYSGSHWSIDELAERAGEARP